MKQKFIFLAALAGVIIALDQVTKIYVHTHFQLNESISVISDLFNITYVRNFGAAFGFLQESHPEFREVFFLTVPPIALGIIIMILRGVESTDKWQVFALSSIFGGALGNYIDRLRFRYVIDFLDFHLYNRYTWPAFNVADSAIVIGVMVLLVLMLFESREKKQDSEEAPSQ